MGDFSILANRIKELRKNEKLTQREFAKKVGCTAATLSAYENGSKSPSLDIVKGIAEKCNVSLDWLCGLSDKEKENIEIKTYSDLYNLLFLIESSVKCLAFGNIRISASRLDSEEGYVEYDEIIKSIYFDNATIVAFLNEWEKMKSLHDLVTIDDDVYNLWKEKILNKNSENSIVHDFQNIDIDENLPFN